MKILLADQLMINVSAMNILFSTGRPTIIVSGCLAVSALHTTRINRPGKLKANVYRLIPCCVHGIGTLFISRYS
ncbi:hypothetical protein L3C95_17895 [Chitinophaga filiformis]|uniref:hypothetical protein n=1 Tax=Chitinophaga filiformis TaxID=104663 RepID=UPI001F23EE74|nr:hypothetical protein [Chitinophaga filiformis]MCF6404776.1 hypothetical protein [Chitinophaga filiformis]